MAKRVTVMLDDEIVKKIRELQAKKLRSADHAISFSRVLNEVARKALK